MTDISIVLGSESDSLVADKAKKILDEHKVDYEVVVLSAHRNPEELAEYVKNSNSKIFIGIAGLSAALPGTIAAHTDKPVIGVPVNAKLGGLDSLLSIAQMPKGVPVACVGIGRADNAALLAMKILNLPRH